MRTDQELALVRAACRKENNQELYWLFSRAQVEFVLKELDLVNTSSGLIMSRYQEMVLPVLSLETYFAVAESSGLPENKFLVIRSVDQNQKLHRLIVQSTFSPQFMKLAGSFNTVGGFTTAENRGHILGAYSLGSDKVGVVPDVVSICQGLRELSTAPAV